MLANEPELNVLHSIHLHWARSQNVIVAFSCLLDHGRYLTMHQIFLLGYWHRLSETIVRKKREENMFWMEILFVFNWEFENFTFTKTHIRKILNSKIRFRQLCVRKMLVISNNRISFCLEFLVILNVFLLYFSKAYEWFRGISC